MKAEYEQLLRDWLRRRKRLRRLLRPLPRRDNLHRYPVIKWFAGYARRAPYLWSFKRAQMMPAIYVGSIISLLPLYGIQLIVAFMAALLFRGNLTVMVALQFITNPFTIVPIYGFTAWLGVVLMRFAGVGEQLPTAIYYANALFIGGTIVGLAVGILTDLTWRILAWESRQFAARLQKLRMHAEAAQPAAAAEAKDATPSLENDG